ncbi:unnamed protein product [Closterium sp. Naga37s-1]|nr:unnamed protein product [Closterium sp. Naga37s-1]
MLQSVCVRTLGVLPAPEAQAKACSSSFEAHLSPRSLPPLLTVPSPSPHLLFMSPVAPSLFLFRLRVFNKFPFPIPSSPIHPPPPPPSRNLRQTIFNKFVGGSARSDGVVVDEAELQLPACIQSPPPGSPLASLLPRSPSTPLSTPSPPIPSRLPRQTIFNKIVGGSARSDGVVVDEAELQRHQQLERLYNTTKSAKVRMGAEEWDGVGEWDRAVQMDEAELRRQQQLERLYNTTKSAKRQQQLERLYNTTKSAKVRMGAEEWDGVGEWDRAVQMDEAELQRHQLLERLYNTTKSAKASRAFSELGNLFPFCNLPHGSPLFLASPRSLPLPDACVPPPLRLLSVSRPPQHFQREMVKGIEHFQREMVRALEGITSFSPFCHLPRDHPPWFPFLPLLFASPRIPVNPLSASLPPPLCLIFAKLSEECRKYGAPESPGGSTVLGRAALHFGAAHSAIEKERDNMDRTLGTQVGDPLKAMVTGAPLEDARSLTHRYDKLRQEAEGLVVEIQKRNQKARDGLSNPENAAKLQQAEQKLGELAATMTVLGREAATAMMAVEAQQQRQTLQRLIGMVEAERAFHQRSVEILNHLHAQMVGERQKNDHSGNSSSAGGGAGATPAGVGSTNPFAGSAEPPPPSYEEVRGGGGPAGGGSNRAGYFLAEVVHAFEAEGPGEMTLHVGDYVVVRQVSPNGWSEGEAKGKAGWFPSAFVERRQRAPASKILEASGGL